eukprot:TRINITY_DN67907_c0_g1_i1.p1 TRINITY_DN67907_c0_g1~~TRINITY_DN67907_c0_g1_i1.p1  ORF type:complete len:355 (-),score=24.30 TRINITY_DN67907_c0_g1_i1:214-1278(-)
MPTTVKVHAKDTRKLKPGDVIAEWKTTDDYEVRPDGSYRRVAGSGVAPHAVLEALNYDAPSYALCGDIRADGGFLPPLNDTVPIARQQLTRKTKRFDHKPHKQGPCGEVGAAVYDPEPCRKPAPPRRDKPWGSTRPQKGVFSSYAHVPEGPPRPRPDDPSAYKRGDDRATRAGVPGRDLFSTYEHIPPGGGPPQPRPGGGLLAGKGPEVFDDADRHGPAMVSAPPPHAPGNDLPNIRTGGPKGPLNPYPEHMPEPEPPRVVRVSKRGMLICVPHEGATYPVMNVWDAPLPQSRAAPARDRASGRTLHRTNPAVTSGGPSLVGHEAVGGRAGGMMPGSFGRIAAMPSMAASFAPR